MQSLGGLQTNQCMYIVHHSHIRVTPLSSPTYIDNVYSMCVLRSLILHLYLFLCFNLTKYEFLALHVFNNNGLLRTGLGKLPLETTYIKFVGLINAKHRVVHHNITIKIRYYTAILAAHYVYIKKYLFFQLNLSSSHVYLILFESIFVSLTTRVSFALLD